MRKVSVLTLVAMTFAKIALAAPFDAGGPDVNPIFGDKPYVIDLREIASQDSKPLKLSEFAPDSDNRVKGVRIVSEGRLIPIVYEVITFPAKTHTDNILETISGSLVNHDEIVLKELGNSEYLGHLLRYFQRVSEKGRPHHISSNYIFVRGDTVYHIVATSFGTLVAPRENWGDLKPDQNAHDAAVVLLRSLRHK